MTVSGASLSKIKKKLLPDTDGQDVLRLRTGVVNVVNADGTADIVLSGATIASVPALGSAMVWPGANVQILSYRGSLLILGPSGSGKRIIRKSADQALSASSITLQNVTEMTFTGKANATYQLTLLLAYTGDPDQDLAVAWTVPAGADMLRYVTGPATNSGNSEINSMSSLRRSPGTAQATGVPTTNNGFTDYREDVFLTMGSVDGTIQLQSANAVAGVASPIAVIRIGSLLIIEHIG